MLLFLLFPVLVVLVLVLVHRQARENNYSSSTRDPYAIKVGADRQALVPLLQQRRPKQPTADEAHYLGTAMYTPPAAGAAVRGHNGSSSSAAGGGQLQNGRVFKQLYLAARSAAERRQLLEQWVNSSDQQLGAQQVKVSENRQWWTSV